MLYKLLLPDGKTYRIKNSVSLLHVILILWLFIGIVIIVYSEYTKTGISIIAFIWLLVVLIWVRPSKTRILPSEQIIRIDTGVRGKEPLQYHFSDFEGFEIQTVYYMRIPVNTELFVRFNINGSSHRHVLGQSFGRKRMQQLCNELETVFQQDT